MLNKQDAVQMIDLVAESPRQQIFSANLKRLALGVLRFHCHKLRPHHIAAKSRNRKTTLFLSLFAFRMNNFRIDQYNFSFRIFSRGHIHYRQSQIFSDLRSSQPHALRRIHRREHVLGQFFELWPKLRNHTRRLFKNRIAVFNNGINLSRWSGWHCRRNGLRRRRHRLRIRRFVGHSYRNSAAFPPANLLQIFAEKHPLTQGPPLLRPPLLRPAPRTSPNARTPPAPAPSSPNPLCATPVSTSKSASNIRAPPRLAR